MIPLANVTNQNKGPGWLSRDPIFTIRIVTTFSWTGAAGTPGYLNDRRPVAARQQVPTGHGYPDPGVPGGEHIRIPVRWPRSAARPNAAASVPAAAASAAWPDPKH